MKEIAEGETAPQKISSVDVLQSIQSVRYVKNGERGCWWKAALANGGVHAGWYDIPRELLARPDYPAIEKMLADPGSNRGAAKRDFEALRHLLDRPSRHVWVTFEDGYLWWCTVRDGAVFPTTGGNFCLRCERGWSNRSINGRLLAMADLPGTITSTAGFRGTVCVPSAEQQFLRIIRDQKSPEAQSVADARLRYERALETAVRALPWRDFERLVDLILARTGWLRVSSIGETQEGVDIEAQNIAANEVAFVQVKSQADQSILDDYVGRFEDRRARYARMIFAVHTPVGKLASPSDPSVQVWTADKLARMAVQVGLGDWLANKLP